MILNLIPEENPSSIIKDTVSFLLSLPEGED
jgi:hypothetical protein